MGVFYFRKRRFLLFKDRVMGENQQAYESDTPRCPVCGGPTIFHEANPPSPAYYWCSHCQAGWDASRLAVAAAA